MTDGNEKTRAWLTVDRVAAFVDGILAIVITILVLGIEVPKDHDFTREGIWSFLLKTQHDVLVYLLGFILIGVYWLQHHVMWHYIARTDRRFIFQNGLFVFLLSLSPFVTEFAGEYHEVPVVRALFGVTYLLAGLVFLHMWRYCTARPYLLRKPIDPEVRRSMTLRILVAPVLILVAIILAFSRFHISALVFLSIPVFYLRHWLVDTAWRTEE
ncbi:MAG: TMEM175 family protein [Rubricoccaceae bacterium]|nr:TMEM175 family protein [Rubricoccaceae bacterium]